MTILDLRGLRERLSRAIAPAPLPRAACDDDADPLSRPSQPYLRDMFADPRVAGCEGPPAPAHNAADLHRDPVRATARAVAHSAWRP